MTRKARAEKQPRSALTCYQETAADDAEPTTPLERLRYFCSLAMQAQDWLDVEPFFDALVAAQAGTALRAADAARAEPAAWMNAVGGVLSAAQIHDLRNHQGRPGAAIAALYSTPLYAVFQEPAK